MPIICPDLDRARPDHLGAYDYRRDTSPAADEMAGTSEVFDHCFAIDRPA